MTATDVASGSRSAVAEVGSSGGNNEFIQTNADDDGAEWTCHLKWIPWNSGKIPIVMQSRNGPCPLIATINVLLLREKLKLPTMLEQITATQLLAYLAECIMDSVPADIQNDENAILNLEQNIHDAIEILPKLKTGLDVNIRFTGITDFEYTPECIIFDLLRIPLFHGWLIDPDLFELKQAIGSQSYNQLVDNIITNKTSTEPEAIAKVLLAEEFLEQTASQLTLHGLNELKSKIKDNEIGILFRNNHFLTLFKRESELYTLVTDHGYLTEDNIIWEILDNIEGAGRFFDASFLDSEATKRQQLDNDYLVALSLHKEENDQNPLKVKWNALNKPVDQQELSNLMNDLSIKKEENNQNLIRDSESMALSASAAESMLQDDFELAKYLQSQEDGLVDNLMREEKKLFHHTEVDQTRLQQKDATEFHSTRSEPIPEASSHLPNDSVNPSSLSSTKLQEVPSDAQGACEMNTSNPTTVEKVNLDERFQAPCDTNQPASQNHPASSTALDPEIKSQTVLANEEAIVTPPSQAAAVVATTTVITTPTTTTASANPVSQRPTSSSSSSCSTTMTSNTRRQTCEKNVKETKCIVH